EHLRVDRRRRLPRHGAAGPDTRDRRTCRLHARARWHRVLVVRAPRRAGRDRRGLRHGEPGHECRSLGDAGAHSARVRRPRIPRTLGAIGVVVPAATGVLPSLTVAAAGGLVAMMLLAMLFHITRREWPNIGLNLVLGALAFAVAY